MSFIPFGQIYQIPLMMLLFKKPRERINQSVWLILVAVVMQGIISSCHRDDEILPQTNQV